MPQINGTGDFTKKTVIVRVDRVEEHIAVCYAPDGEGMTDVSLPKELWNDVKDGVRLEVTYSGTEILSVKLCDSEDPESENRRRRLDRLFGR